MDSGPPLKVNSQTKVTSQNADQLDKDSSEIGRELWVHVNCKGALARGNGVQSSGRFSTGYYFVQVNRDVSYCGYVATTADGYAGPYRHRTGRSLRLSSGGVRVHRRQHQPCGPTISPGRNLLTLVLSANSPSSTRSR